MQQSHYELRIKNYQLRIVTYELRVLRKIYLDLILQTYENASFFANNAKI